MHYPFINSLKAGCLAEYIVLNNKSGLGLGGFQFDLVYSTDNIATTGSYRWVGVFFQ